LHHNDHNGTSLPKKIGDCAAGGFEIGVGRGGRTPKEFPPL